MPIGHKEYIVAITTEIPNGYTPLISNKPIKILLLDGISYEGLGTEMFCSRFGLKIKVILMDLYAHEMRICSLRMW